MSVRGLATIALILLVLCVGAAVLLVDRLGLRAEAKPIEWTFVNPTLDVARGQRVVLRPIVEGVQMLRYTFLLRITEPPIDDPVAPVPHLRAGVEDYDGDTWYYRSAEALAFCQMGALTAQEWLMEIGPVNEVGGAKGDRVLLKALFGHRSGASISYYHDPEHPVPAVGWIRNEMTTEGRPPEIYFATDGGLAEMPEKEPDEPGDK